MDKEEAKKAAQFIIDNYQKWKYWGENNLRAEIAIQLIQYSRDELKKVQAEVNRLWGEETTNNQTE